MKVLCLSLVLVASGCVCNTHQQDEAFRRYFERTKPLVQKHIEGLKNETVQQTWRNWLLDAETALVKSGQ